MYTNGKHNSQVFSIFEDLKPRQSSNKKYSSKGCPLFTNKLKQSSMKTLNSSTSLIGFDADKPTLDKLSSINHRNKKSNYILFQRSFQQNKKKNGSNSTTVTFLPSSLKPPKNNSSYVLSPFAKTGTSKIRNISSKGDAIIKELRQDSYFSTKENKEISNDDIDKLIDELKAQFGKIKENDMNKLIDLKFEIVKNSLSNYAQIIKKEKEKRYLLMIIDLISTIFKYKSDQLGELTTNNSSLDNHLFNFNKKNSYKDSNSSKVLKLSNKTSLDTNDFNKLFNKEEISNNKNEESSSGSYEELESIQFCDKIHLQKTNSMPNLNLPKLYLNFDKNAHMKTRNINITKQAMKYNKNKKEKTTYAPTNGMKRIFHYTNI